MPFSRSGRRISMEQYERDEDVWPPRLPAKSAAEQKARAAADHGRARAQAKEEATMALVEECFQAELDEAAKTRRSIDEPEYPSTQGLLNLIAKGQTRGDR